MAALGNGVVSHRRARASEARGWPPARLRPRRRSADHRPSTGGHRGSREASRLDRQHRPAGGGWARPSWHWGHRRQFSRARGMSASCCRCPIPKSREFTHTPARGQLRSSEAQREAYEQAIRQRWQALALVDRPAPDTTHARMRGQRHQIRQATTAEVRLDAWRSPVQRCSVVNRRLRTPLARDERCCPLLKSFKKSILARTHRESGECRLGELGPAEQVTVLLGRTKNGTLRQRKSCCCLSEPARGTDPHDRGMPFDQPCLRQKVCTVNCR